MIDELIGHYRVVATLGSGGMGVVWKAIDTRLNRPVAIKAIRDVDAVNTDAVLRLRAEALAAASLDHPYICKIYELLETGSATLVVMEFVEGETLAQILTRGVPPLVDTLRYGSEIAEGLANAHARGIIHRDVKPGNVMITPHGHVKLLDFGVARINDPAAVTQSGLTLPGNVPGTPHYIAPEQALGRPFDARADLFSLGVLLFRCLTGQLPFAGETRDAYIQEMLAGRLRSIEQLAPAAPEAVRDIVIRCLARDPARRPASAIEVGDALRRSAELLSTGTAVVASGRSPGLPKWVLQTGGFALALVAIALVASRWTAEEPDSAVRRELVPVVTWPSAESDARISPDGRWLSFVSDKNGPGSLFVQSMAGGEPVAVNIPGVVLSHAWSPSANEIAAAVRQGDALFLAVVPAFFGGSPRLSVPLPPDSQNPLLRRWTASGIFLDLYLRGSPSLWRAASDTGTFEPVSAKWTPQLRFRDFDVSPDGQRVVIAAIEGGRNDLWTGGIDGTAFARLTDDAAVERNPLWIDGQTVAFESNRGGQLDLWQMDVSTRRLTQLTSSLAEEEPSGASAGGEVIAFEERSANVNIWRLDLATGGARALTADALSDYWPSASGDGSRVAFQRARPTPAEGYQFFDARIFVAPLSGSAIEGQPVDDGFGASLSSDGDWLAYYQRLPTPDRLRLVVRHTRTGEVRALSDRIALPALSVTQPVDWIDQNLAWRPAAPELYFVTRDDTGHQIRVAKLDARGEPSIVVTDTTARLRNLRFSPDGASLAWQASMPDTVELRTLRLGSGQPVPAARFGRDRELLVPGWISNERLLVVQGRHTPPNGHELELSDVSLDGGLRRLAVLSNSFLPTTRLDAAARRVFVTRAVDGIHNIFAVSLDDGSVRQVTANDARGVSFSGIHPLGPDAILFARDERKRDIWIVKRTSEQ